MTNHVLSADGRSELRRVGRALAWGALVELWSWVWPGFLAWVVLGLVLHALLPRDSTDPTNGPRSALTIRTDALTGCSYLESGAGALTPRLGRDGRQLCTRGAR